MALALVAAVATTVMSGCQTVQSIAKNENLKNVVSTMLTNYVGGIGTTTNYSGTLSSQLLKKSGSSYVFVNSNGNYATQTITLPVIASSNVATITLPEQTIDGAKMSQVSVGNITISKSGTTSTITVGDSSTASGTLTVDGTIYNISGAYLDKCTYTDAGAFEGGTIQFYFGTDNEYVASFKFSGKKK